MRASFPERCRAYAAGSRDEHFAWWSGEHCIQTIDQFAGLPLVYEPWQRAFLNEALAVNGDGTPYWTSVVLCVPRKNGKTTLLSAYALYHLLEDDGRPEILFAASSNEQADKLFTAATMFVLQSPFLIPQCHLRDYDGEIVRVDGMGVIQRLASDAKTLHGANPSLVVADELAQWTTPTLRKSFAALTTGGGARKRRQLFSISTAGDAADREESILGRIIDANERGDDVESPAEALTISRNHRARVLVYNYSAGVTARKAPIARIKAANPASWITEAYLEEQQENPEIDDADFLQLHAGVWAEGTGSYIAADLWKELGDGAAVTEGAAVALGMDGSRTHDTTVVAWAALADDGRVDVDCRIFSVRRDAPHHELHEGGKIDYDRVEEFVIDRFGFFRVGLAGYDPRYLDRSAEIVDRRLPESKIVVIEPQSKLMRDAIAAFERGALDRKIRHRGDSAIASHVAAVKAERDEKGIVIRKRKHTKPIDAVVAMAIAYWLVTSRRAESVYERKGLLTV